MNFITHIRDWYGRFERPISSVFLLGGFVFDSLTLRSVDRVWENLLILVHLLIVAGCIIFINLKENDDIPDEKQSKLHFWLINIMQFSFGGLLSVFLVFYFRSATLAVTWPFIVILILAFIANESFKKHYERLAFQVSFLYLSILSFAIFIVPVFFHKIGTGIFLISGLSSLLVIWLFTLILKYFSREKFFRSRNTLIVCISAIFLLTNILYFFNLIPPIPLSLKDAGVYHSISRNSSGDYVVQSEDTDWQDYFKLHQTFHKASGDRIYVYSAIFSPAAFNTAIIHDWQRYDPNNREWGSANRIYLSASGGRQEGYRTYSTKSDVSPGQWRVDVKTAGGQTIGRIRFNVSSVSSTPVLKSEIK